MVVWFRHTRVYIYVHCTMYNVRCTRTFWIWHVHFLWVIWRFLKVIKTKSETINQILCWSLYLHNERIACACFALHCIASHRNCIVRDERNVLPKWQVVIVLSKNFATNSRIDVDSTMFASFPNWNGMEWHAKPNAGSYLHNVFYCQRISFLPAGKKVTYRRNWSKTFYKIWQCGAITTPTFAQSGSDEERESEREWAM